MVSIATLFFCFCSVLSLLTAVPAIVLAIIGVTSMTSNPSTSRKCTLVAWILVGCSFLIAVLYWLFFIMLGFGSAYFDAYGY